MKFSIITPLYNKEQYIAETIDSVLAQTYTDFEFIIVNDSSTDRSAEVVKSYDDYRIQLYTKPNGGVSAARNYGIKKASGEIICFLDADDLWKNNYLEELNKTIILYPEISFFCSSYLSFVGEPSKIVDHTDLKNKYPGEIIVVDYFEASIKYFGSVALTSAVAVKKSLLDTMDYWFDEKYCIGEDNDMWVRVALKSRLVYNNNPLMLYRQFAVDGLTTKRSGIKNAVDYSCWYKIDNNKVHKFATQTLYTKARQCYKESRYNDSITCLKLSKGRYLLFRRIILYFLSLYKSK